MTDPVKMAEDVLHEWRKDCSPTFMVLIANAIRKAQQEGIEEGKRQAAARPGVDREKVLMLLEAASSSGNIIAIDCLIRAVRLLVKGE